MALVERFKSLCLQYFSLNTPVILAVSGGIDSVVLCELSHQAGLNFSIAHCNFQLRGEESDRDEEFVRKLAKKYNVTVFVKKFQTKNFAEENKLSIQEAARDLRYGWFDELKDESKSAFVLLAHHANDNIETVLMNFFRGTGMEGLAGMKLLSPSGNCLRPMLDFTKKEIEDFAKQYESTWVEDSSNQSSKYTRNFFRNELIPSIAKVYPKVEQVLMENIHRFKQINAFYKQSVEQVIEKISKTDKTGLHIPVRTLMKYKDTSLIYELISKFGFGEKQVDEVIKLFEADSGKFMENENYQIIRHRNWLIFSKKYEPGKVVILIEEDQSEVFFEDQKLNFNLSSDTKIQSQKDEALAQLDAKRITFPLILRRWKTGDYFYPLGMAKKKKLSRFFIDKKLPKNLKEKVWVVESNKKIIWVVGMRIDERFKITEKTKSVLKISLTSP